jgi:hypothetical protein
MARRTITVVRPDPENAKTLVFAREDGLSPSGLIRKGSRQVVPLPSSGRKPPSICLFVSTDPLLGEESELFKDKE